MGDGGVRAAIAEFTAYVFTPDDLVEVRRLPSKISSFHSAIDLSREAASLVRDNERGQNVYVGANPRKRSGARDRDGVALARCLFADFDHMVLGLASARWRQAGLPDPGLVVNSGNGIHAYWRLTEPLTDLAQWRHLQRRLIAALDSDHKVKDSPRILRLPGLLNIKKPGHPKQCLTLMCSLGRTFDLSDLVRHLPEVPSDERADDRSSPADPATVKRAAAYLARVPPAVEGKGGDAHTYRAACWLVRDYGLTVDQAMPLLREWNKRCVPPWEAGELRDKCENAQRYGTAAVGNRQTQPSGERGGSPGGRPPERPAAPTAVLRRAKDVRRAAVSWLWPHRIALGKLTLLVGDPEIGKSLTTVDLASRVSRGAGWPDGSRAVNGSVIMLSAEDDPNDTIRPRLEAARADLARVLLLEGVREDGEGTERPFSLAGDMAVLSDAMERTPECRLVTIDPLGSYMGRVDTHSETLVRGALGPLIRAASRLGVAVLCVCHLRKGEGAIIERVMGSRAFVAQARAVWLAEKDHQDPTGDRRILRPVKNNLTSDRQESVYRIRGPEGSPFIDWEERPAAHRPDGQ